MICVREKIFRKIWIFASKITETFHIGAEKNMATTSKAFPKPLLHQFQKYLFPLWRKDPEYSKTYQQFVFQYLRELWLRMKDHTFFWHPVVTPTFFNLSSIGHEIKLIVSYQSKQIKGNVPLPFFLIAATLLYFYMFFQHNFLFLSIIFHMWILICKCHRDCVSVIGYS